MGLRFRTRLTVMITGLVGLAGLLLLGIEYVIVTQLFRASITTVPEQVTEYRPTMPYVTQESPVLTRSAVEAEQASVVLAGLMPWSVLALVGCTAVAGVLSWFLAGRAVGRITEVTRMARDLSTQDLHRRLSLPGPADEIKELGDTFDGMLNRLETAFSAQQRFVANASHELRTPLTVSRTALEIPLAQGRVPPHMEGPVRTALRAGRQSERLIGSLLELTRGTDVPVETTPEDLSAIVDDAVLDTAEAAARAEVTVINRQLPGVTVAADRTMIGQAVSNLVDNAITHNQRHGTVWIDSTRVGDRVELRIENTGRVLASSTVALLREPFYRGAESRTARPAAGNGRNVGLGLALVDLIVTRHGGTLDLAPREGGGLVATVTLAGAPPTGRMPLDRSAPPA